MGSEAFTGAEPGASGNGALGRPLDNVLRAVEAHGYGPVKRKGKNYNCKCPVHGDESPSLDISEGSDGRVLFRCRSHGCETRLIIDALGLTWQDVFADAPLSSGTPQAVYPYTDEMGRLAFEVCRYPGKDFRQRRVLPNGERVWGLGDTPRYLYRLPQVHEAVQQGWPVYVVEGEKDVHAVERALKREGIPGVATCNPMGAGKWREEHAAALNGARQVYVVADIDEHGGGRAHAEAVHGSLTGQVTAVELLRAAEGKDPYDHLILHGRRLSEFVALEAPGVPVPRLRIMPASEFLLLDDTHAPPLVGTEQDTLVTTGGLLIMAGEGGASKTTLTLDGIAHFASGTPWLGWPTGNGHGAVRVLVIENEGPRPKFRQKLAAKQEAWAGEPFLDNVYVYTEPWGHFSFAEEAQRAELRDALTELRIDLVVADPLDSLGVEGVGGPDETRQFMAWLKECGLFDDVAYWVLHHYGKDKYQRSVVQRLSGAWGGHPDSILGVQIEGRQRTRLTYAKLRWAEQREPVLLEWELEHRGFKVVERAQEIPDEQLAHRIDAYLEAHPGASTKDLVSEVKGTDKRLRAVLKLYAEEGRYVNTSGNPKRPTWELAKRASQSTLGSPESDVPEQTPTGTSDEEYPF